MFLKEEGSSLCNIRRITAVAQVSLKKAKAIEGRFSGHNPRTLLNQRLNMILVCIGAFVTHVANTNYPQRVLYYTNSTSPAPGLCPDKLQTT